MSPELPLFFLFRSFSLIWIIWVNRVNMVYSGPQKYGISLDEISVKINLCKIPESFGIPKTSLVCSVAEHQSGAVISCRPQEPCHMVLILSYSASRPGGHFIARSYETLCWHLNLFGESIK